MCSQRDENAELRQLFNRFLDNNNNSEMNDPRVAILQAAIGHTAKARPSVYGKPEKNMSAQMALIKAYQEHSRGQHGPAHDMAIYSLLIKVGRIASGSFHLDNYEDGAAYLAIAGECGISYQAGARPDSGPVSQVSGNLRPIGDDASGD